MKRIIVAAATAAMIAGYAGSASAADVNKTIDINAQVDSKCGISAQQSVVTLGDITDANAKVRNAVTQEIATGLNNDNIVAFCNAPNSTVTVTRAVLARNNASGNGLADGGFAQFVRYNLDASIGGVALDSTSTDGGSTVAPRFGGHDSLSEASTHVAFQPATSNGAPVASSSGSSPTATNWSSLTDRRLASGAYTGSVNITLTPGA